uniref:GOLD domain-containing protein n=1 Tax=Cuerna arida TaxID=1464854 RepID=A0A1B6G435_9HEMI
MFMFMLDNLRWKLQAALYILSILLLLVPATSAWIVQVDSFTDECFYEWAEQGSKVGFTFQVVEGGFLDIDVTVHGPDGREVHGGSRETNGKFTFTAYQEGKYKFCFSNQMSTVTPKRVMFNVMVRSPDDPAEVTKSNKLQGMIVALDDALRGVRNEQDYVLVRDNMHRNTNEHTNNVIVYWSTFEVFLIIAGTGYQVWYIKRFFEVRRIL